MNELALVAVDAAGNISETRSVVITFDDTAPGSVPLTVTNGGDGVTAQLNWQTYDVSQNGNDIARYRIYHSGQPFTTVSDAQVQTIAVIDNHQIQHYQAEGLRKNALHYFAVVAEDQQGQAIENVEAVAITLEDQQAPEEITALTIVSEANDLYLHWSPSINTRVIYRAIVFM